MDRMIWIPDLHFMEFISYLIELLLQRILDNNITGILMRKIYAGCTFGLSKLDTSLILSKNIIQFQEYSWF